MGVFTVIGSPLVSVYNLNSLLKQLTLFKYTFDPYGYFDEDRKNVLYFSDADSLAIGRYRFRFVLGVI